MNRTDAQSYFRTLLLTVVGQAYTAAGYLLEDNPVQQVGGRFRFVKPLDAEFSAYLEYQVLIYSDTEFAMRTPSRFRINLIRSNQKGAKPSTHPRYAQRTLSQLVVTDFGVSILPEADYWWTYTDTQSLGKALAEAGHLVVGYGIGWLQGDLIPPTP